LDAGTTVHGHGTNITFLNATMIQTELRESVFGACDAFIPMLFAETPPGAHSAASIGLLMIFVVAVCILFAAFVVFGRSNEDRDMIKKLQGLDQRDLGIDSPLYDAPGFAAPSDQGYLNVNPMYSGYSSSGYSDDDDTTEPSWDHRRLGPFKQSKGDKGAKHSTKNLKRLAREDWVASMPADVKAMAALEIMFDVKQKNEDSNHWGISASGSLATGAGLSRKERRASKKAVKKAQQAGANYYSGAFDSPLSNVNPIYSSSDSRNTSDDEHGSFAQDDAEGRGKISKEWG